MYLLIYPYILLIHLLYIYICIYETSVFISTYIWSVLQYVPCFFEEFRSEIYERKKTSTETIHRKSSQVICTRSSDTAGGPSASQSPWSVQKIRNMLHQTCFSPWKLEKSSFCPHIFVWRGPFFFGEWLLIFFQKTQITKIRRALFRFPGFSWPRRGGHFIVVCPTFATTNGSSKFSASWDEKKNSMWDMGKFCGSCVFVWRKG